MNNEDYTTPFRNVVKPRLSIFHIPIHRYFRMKSVIVSLLVRIAASCMTTPDIELPDLETTTILEDTTTEGTSMGKSTVQATDIAETRIMLMQLHVAKH